MQTKSSSATLEDMLCELYIHYKYKAISVNTKCIKYNIHNINTIIMLYLCAVYVIYTHTLYSNNDIMKYI